MAESSSPEESSRDRSLIDSALRQVGELSPTRSAASGVGGQWLPGYEIVNEQHRGGQGVVYRAVQKATGQEVAVKVLREGLFASGMGRARFEREVRVLALLRHPNIVAIHDSGEIQGSFYCVMDFIDGNNLDVVISRDSPPLRDRVQLFRTIAQAVGSAHLRGVIHRDLKPSNIRVDLEGEPHVLDFGLAKWEADEDGRDAKEMLSPALATVARQFQTSTGEFVGSIPWASPEQVEGHAGALDVRTDVYSLGVVFYQMSTGQFPYDISGSYRHSFEQVVHATPTPPRRYEPAMDEDLETILLKCLAKDPDRRYQSAGELARDLEQHLEGRPISARRDSSWYVLRKSLFQHRWLAGAVGVVLLLAISFAGYWVINRSHLASLYDQYRNTAQRLDSLLQARELEALDEAWNQANLERVTELLESIPAPRRSWFADRFSASLSLNQWTVRLENDVVLAAACSPDGEQVVTGSWNGRLQLLEAASGALIWEEGELLPDVRAVRFVAEGTRIVTAGSTGVDVFDSESGRHLRMLEVETGGLEVVAAHGNELFAATTDGRVFSWSLEQGSLRSQWKFRHPSAEPDPSSALSGVQCLALDPVARRVVTGGRGIVRLWSLDAPEPIRTYSSLQLGFDSPVSIRSVALHVGEGLLAVGLTGNETQVNRITLLELESGERRSNLDGHTHFILDLEFDLAGRRLLSSSRDSTIRVWDLATGSLLATLLGHRGRVEALSFSPGASNFVSVGSDGTVRSWRAPVMLHRLDPTFGEPVGIFGVDLQAQVMAWNGTSLHPYRVNGSGGFERVDNTDPWPVAASRRIVWSAAADGSVVVGAATGPLFWRNVAGVQTLNPDRTVLAVGHSGMQVWMGLEDGTLEHMDQNTGERQQHRKHLGEEISAVAVNTNPDMVAVATRGGAIALHERSGDVRWSLPCPSQSEIRCLSFLDDGKVLAAGTDRGSIQLFSTPYGDRLPDLGEHPQPITDLLFLPASRQLYSLDVGGGLRQWGQGRRTNQN